MKEKKCSGLSYYPVILALIFLLGLALRLYKLDFQSFWSDEYLNIQIAQKSTHYFLSCLHSLVPPLYIYLLAGWLKFFPPSEITVRLPGALIGAVTIPAFYFLAKEMFNKKTALFAAFLLAISTIHIIYSQEAKYYSLALLLTILMHFEYLKILNSPQRKHFILYGVYFTLMLFAHYYFAIFFLVHWSHLFLNYAKNRKLLRNIFLVHCCIILCLAPTILYFLSTLDALGPTPWVPKPTLNLPIYSLIAIFAGEQWPSHWPPYIKKEMVPVLYIGFILFSIFIFWLKNKKEQMHKNHFSLIVLWTILPNIFAYIFSMLFCSVYLPRYLLMTMFSAYLFLAWMIANELLSKKDLWLSFSCLFIFFAYTGINYAGLKFYFTHPIRPQFRQAVDFVNNNCPDQILAVYGRGLECNLVKYYFIKGGSPKNIVCSKQLSNFRAENFNWIIDTSSNAKLSPSTFGKKSFLSLDVYYAYHPTPHNIDPTKYH